MTAIIVGAVFVALGAWGLVLWFSSLVIVLKGFLPISILIGGVVSMIAGISSFQAGGNGPSKK